jgi:hypothetical protein
MSAISKPRYMEKYNRQKLIGSGAFGQAWLVQAKADGKQLVMKEIKIAKVRNVFCIWNFSSGTLCFLIDG